MPQYTDIAIIYNPNSTGASEKVARSMQAKLQKASKSLKVKLAPTERAGHATELAYELAKRSAHPLIISASGDGGYHEVVNGLMCAQAEGAHPVAGLLPAGNANDHFHDLHTGDFVEAVAHGTEQCIDLLKLAATQDGRPFERYAHSYIGMGLSSKVGRDLNESRFKRFGDVLIFCKSLLSFKPVQLEVDGAVRDYDSLIFSNISKMSKVLALSRDARADDGKFEITAVHPRGRFNIIGALLKASTTGLTDAQQADTFAFRTIVPTHVQLDGEVMKLDVATAATVTLEHCVLHCIV